ncbi:Ty3-gypsy retrotransposon protein [Entamoeba marina]
MKPTTQRNSRLTIGAKKKFFSAKQNQYNTVTPIVEQLIHDKKQVNHKQPTADSQTDVLIHLVDELKKVEEKSTRLEMIENILLEVEKAHLRNTETLKNVNESLDKQTKIIEEVLNN